MSLLDYLESFHRAIGKFDEYGFAESLDIKEEILSKANFDPKPLFFKTT